MVKKMDKLFFIGIIIYISALPITSAEPSEAVRITGSKLHYLNGDYINKTTFKAKLVKVNSTYTRLQIEWDVIKDFPLDTILETKLVRKKTKNGQYEHFNTYVSYICDMNDKYHKYLPEFLIQLTKDGNCIKKGHYHFYDAGQFKFYNLLSKEDMDGYYFDTYNFIRSYKLTIKDVDISSVSNMIQ